MDFEDSGIESDPKVNSDSIDTFNQNEPIISFSPERCRFDLGQQASSRKSSTSFPISVADLQLDEPAVSALYQSSNAKNCNSIANLQNSSTTGVPRNLSIHLNHNSLTQNDQQQQPPPSQPLFQKQAFPFLHQQHQPSISTFPTSAIVPGAVINTHSTATLNSTGSTSSANNSNNVNTVPSHFPSKGSTTNAPDCNSIPLMVNGAAISTSNTQSTLDLQKRLEKHIAQATAPVPVGLPTLSHTSSSLSKAKSNSAGSKHQNDSIISDNIPIPSSISSIATSKGGSGNGNQISFSPSEPSGSAPSHIFQTKLSSSSLWESDSSIDLWESKIAPKTGDGRIGDGFDLDDDIEKPSSSNVMEGLLDTPSRPIQVDVDHISATSLDACSVKNDNEYNSNSSGIAKLVLTTKTTSVNTSSSETSSNVNKSRKAATCKTNNNQSLRNNATNPSNATAGAATTNSTASSAVAAASGSASSTFSSSTPSVITVGNSGFDIRKVSALLPPQRLAIPNKPNPQLQSSHLTNNSKTTGNTTSLSTSGGSATTTNANGNNCSGTTVTFSASPFSSSNPCTTTTSVYDSSSLSTAVHKTSMSRTASVSETSCNNSSSNSMLPSGNGNAIKAGSNSNSSKLSSEKKPLVQWDSDESEEELSFFPPSKRGVITDNLSIDNMSLSGEEEDLHLTPPRPLTKKCPCDPRTWLERNDISNHHHGDSTHSISSRPCVIS